MMSMKIKFRGKRIDNGEWVYGYLVQDPTGQFRIYWQPFAEASNNTYHFVIADTVGQFTGLTDNDGVEIYENDLRVDSDGVIFRIYRTFGGFVIKAHYWKSNCQDLIPTDQLIFESLSDPQTADWLCSATFHLSNIHENPELLK